MLPALPLPRHLVAVLVVDHRVDAEDARAAAARLHRLQRGQRAAEEAAVLGLPPGVDDRRLALADLGVVPAPDLGLDRLAHRGHVLEVVVVLLRLLRADLAQHPDGGGRGVEDVHPELLRDPPGPPAVGVVGHALVDHRGRAERQRAVDDVGVAGDPADVGHAPVHVVRGGCPGSTSTSRPRRTGSRRCCAGSPSGGRWCRWCTSGTAAPRPAWIPGRRSRPGARPAGRRRTRPGPRPSASAMRTGPGAGATPAPCRLPGLPRRPPRPPRRP